MASRKRKIRALSIFKRMWTGGSKDDALDSYREIMRMMSNGR